MPWECGIEICAISVVNGKRVGFRSLFVVVAFGLLRLFVCFVVCEVTSGWIPERLVELSPGASDEKRGRWS